jgi:ATP-dependent protease ClpP protease subunit
MRKIYLTGEINDMAYKSFAIQLDQFVSESNQPIEVDLHSHGGEAEAGLAIYSRIRACPCDVHVKAHGRVESAATIVLAGADYRAVGVDCWFMVHDSPLPNKKSSMAQWERMEQQWAEILELHSDLPAAEWRKLSKKTTYLNPAEMLQYGVIDKVLKAVK